MSDTRTPPPPAPGASVPERRPPAAPIRPRWVRPRDGRVVAGVARGAAEALGISIGWARAIFVILALFGGLGLSLYLAGWLLMPAEGEDRSIAAGWFDRVGGGSARWIGAGLIVVAGIVLLSSTGFVRAGWIWAAALLVAGVLLYRGDLDVEAVVRPSREPMAAWDDERGSGTTDDAGAGYAATSDASSHEPVAAPVSASPAPRPAPSILGRLTLAAVLLTGGVLALLDNTGVADPDARHYVAAVLAVLGIGLVIGAWWGRTRASIVFGVLIIPALVLTSVVDLPLRGDFGDVRLHPVTAAELGARQDLAAGELRLDLRDLEEDVDLVAHVGIGLLWVIVPADADVAIVAEVGIGELDLLDVRRGGLGVDREAAGAGSGPHIELDLEVGIGEVRVDRARG